LASVQLIDNGEEKHNNVAKHIILLIVNSCKSTIQICRII